MKPLKLLNNYLIQFLLIPILIFFCLADLPAQVTVEVMVLEGEATSTCRDGLFQGNPLWSVVIENQPEEIYSNDNCTDFISYPNQDFIQFTTDVACWSDLNDGEIQLCLRVFEHDPPLFNRCEIADSDKACLEVMCDNFLLPRPGTDSTYTFTIDNPSLSSSGFVKFKISVSDDANGNPVSTNDRLCHAVNMGQLAAGKRLGDMTDGLYNNFCALPVKEPSPHLAGASWQNNNATWFTFTTSDNPNALVLIEASSDPEQTGEPVNLQLALYQSSDGTCEGNFQLIQEHYDGSNFNEFLVAECLTPNQQYFIMVDGENGTDLIGVYGLQISEVDVVAPTNDDICNAITIDVSTGGSITQMFSNNCATSINDPATTAGFNTTNSVWFKFVPSQSRRVDILVNSDAVYPGGVDPIDPEVAVFYAPTNQCTGALTEVWSREASGNIEFFSLECLNPKLTYYIMVDGAPTDPTGIFSVVVAEKGYNDPIPLDTTICEGDLFLIGNKSYSFPGTYLDTIIMDDDCVDIIETNLIVVKPLTLDVDTLELARGDGQPGGVMFAGTGGGTGRYTYAWSDGQTNQVATNLIGGEDYCVTVSDMGAACQEIFCFTMEYPIPIAALVVNDTVDCSYDVSGQISLTVTAGQAPYQYRVQGIDDPSVLKTGVITLNDNLLMINDLPVGSFNVTISNKFTGNNFVAEVVAPDPMEITLLEKREIDCFGACTGMLEISVTGGTGNHQFVWNELNSNLSILDNICAGEYLITVTDENNCRDSAQYTIIEPAATQVEFSAVEPVNCFGEANGQATVSANQALTNFQWDNGETTATAIGLDAGFHDVMVTDENGCEASGRIEIVQPTSALVANIEVIEPIACGGDTNGVLADASTGGNTNYEYNWNTGNTADFIENLPAGTYSLMVKDEKGCEDQTTVTLEEPTPIDAILSPRDVTCPAGESSGRILIDNAVGGTAPYRFSTDQQDFINTTEITNLPAGNYTVVMQDENGCEKTFNQIIINDPPEVTVDIGQDQKIQLGKAVNLVAMTNREEVSFEWFSTDTLSCLDCKSVSSFPFNKAEYQVRVTDILTGCIAEAAIKVEVLKARKLYIPNVFSPNSDGINDELGVMGGPDIARVLRFEIYARNGSKIYEVKNFEVNQGIGWDGSYNQQKLSTDVFIYFAEVQYIDGAKEVFRGDFTLIR